MMHEHRFDPVSFVFGALFVLLGVAALLQPGVGIGLIARWLIPVGAVTVGVVVLLSVRDRQEPQDR